MTNQEKRYFYLYVWTACNTVAICIMALSFMFPRNTTVHTRIIPNSELSGLQSTKIYVDDELNTFIAGLDYADMSKEEVVEIIKFYTTFLGADPTDLPSQEQMRTPYPILEFFQQQRSAASVP